MNSTAPSRIKETSTLASVASRDDDSAEKLIATMRSFLENEHNSSQTNYSNTRDVGLPICSAIRSFGRGNYRSVIDTLLPIRSRLHEFGGSHAQRDVVERTILEASIRSGQKRVAEKLIQGRLADRPLSTYNLRKSKEILAC